MHFIYTDNKAGSKNGPTINIWKMDPHKQYLNHYDNLLYLKFIAKEGTFVEKYQATKEIEICERKLKFWARHPNFVDESVRQAVEGKIKIWKGRI